MIPQRAFYPWSTDSVESPNSNFDHLDPLESFLNGICLRQYYTTFRRKLRILKPNQFGNFRVSDFLRIGMSEAEINRLVSHLLDLRLPTGKLLADNPDSSDIHWHSAVDLNPLGDCHRPKLLRKLFRKKHAFHFSAPVSPSHYEQHNLPIAGSDTRPYYSIDYPNARQSSNVTGGARRTELPLEDTAHSRHIPTPPPLTCLIPEQDIKLHARIGAGSFGIVHRADWTTPSGEIIPVAVKLLRPEAMAGDFFTSFLDELRAMQCLSHPNLIRLHGVVLSNPIMMVTELAQLGSLLLHLRAQSVCANGSLSSSCLSPTTSLPSVPRALQVDALWDMGVQIACGMAYLSSRGLVHRDLAARNILLASVRQDEYPQVKIGDFGLVRSVAYVSADDLAASNYCTQDCESGDAVYMGRIEQRIPYAWSAPESIRKRIFSQASDVWSWGVTCWEMWTNGAAPWPEMNASQLLSALDSGRRLAWPRMSCPRRLYQLMLACWRSQPNRRPSFAYLADRLDKIRPSEFVAVQSFDEADRLGLETGDVVVVTEGRPQQFWWQGQNRRTGELGSFPRSIVKRGSKLLPEDISAPIPSSFVHLGHCGTNGSQWGFPDKLETSCLSDSVRYADIPGTSSYAASSSLLDLPCDTGDPACTEEIARRKWEEFDTGSWYPVNDCTSSALSLNGSRQADDCCSYTSLDQYSLKLPNLDQYDDEEDERCVFDKAPDPFIPSIGASFTKFARSSASQLPASRSNAMNSKPLQFQCGYQPSDYFAQITLPPPPGPDEGHSKPSCRSLNASMSSIDFCNMHATSLKSSILKESDQKSLPSVNAKEPSTPRNTPSTEPEAVCNRKVEQTSTQNPTAPPLIDLYSHILQPRPFISGVRIPVPSAPIYEPHRPYFFPVHRPVQYPHVHPRPHSMPFPTQSSSEAATISNPWSGPSQTSQMSKSTLNPFEVASSDPFSPDLIERLPSPPADPFDWDDLKRSFPIEPSAKLSDSDPVKIREAGSSSPGPSRQPRCESELLVSSATPNNPFYREMIEQGATKSDAPESLFRPHSPRTTEPIGERTCYYTNPVRERRRPEATCK
ncbi:unnamed protein product [Calicophoron daubneyi]|uniref:non-specific protein-tyrosine kinase n=1 Tax=Calicophoron daubneyi TaxID=300641 RepID=A0AAV2T442_CALDB